MSRHITKNRTHLTSGPTCCFASSPLAAACSSAAESMAAELCAATHVLQFAACDYGTGRLRGSLQGLHKRMFQRGISGQRHQLVSGLPAWSQVHAELSFCHRPAPVVQHREAVLQQVPAQCCKSGLKTGHVLQVAGPSPLSQRCSGRHTTQQLNHC